MRLSAAFSVLLLFISIIFTGRILYSTFTRSPPGRFLPVGQDVSFYHFPRETSNDTRILVEAGGRYALDIVDLKDWADNSIWKNEAGELLDERGFSNSLMPFSWMGHTRRSREHRWFELLLYQSECRRESLKGASDMERDASGRYIFEPVCDGRLVFFVNDARGFYGNNHGSTRLVLSRIN